MKTILLWDPRFPGNEPVCLILDDAVASAAVRAGVAAPVNPADLSGLIAGGAVDGSTLVEAVLQHGAAQTALARVMVPAPVLAAAAAIGKGAPVQNGSSGTVTPPPAQSTAGYDVVLIVGQSNADGRAQRTVADTDVASAFQWATDKTLADYATVGSQAVLHAISSDITPLVGPQPDLQAGHDWFGPGEPFAQLYAPQMPNGRKLLLVNCAVGSTALVSDGAAHGRWWPGTDGSYSPDNGDLYENAIAEAKGALTAAGDGARLIAIYWAQGEFDADAGVVTKDQYVAAATTLIGGFRSRIPGAAAVPFVIGSLVPEFVQANTDRQAINLAHRKLAATLPHVFFLQGHEGETIESEHYNRTGIVTMGTGMFQTITAPAAPAFTSPAAVTVNDGSKLKLFVTTDRFAALTLGGTDAAAFELVTEEPGAAGVANPPVGGRVYAYLRFAGDAAASYASPTDAGANHVFDVAITATNAAGSTAQALAITIRPASPVAAEGGTTTFDPATQPPYNASGLSGGNCIWTGNAATNSPETVKSTTSRTSGKLYAELTVVGSTGAVGFSVATAAFSTSSGSGQYGYPGGTAEGTSYSGRFSSAVGAGVDLGTNAAEIATADVMGLHLNLDAYNATTNAGGRKMWVSKNGVVLNGDPVAGTGGMAIPAGALFLAASVKLAGDVARFNAGQDPFAHYHAEGFVAWG